MRIFADRFLVDDAGAIDLATGEIVRLTVCAHPSAAEARARLATCDQLAALRHPLLIPLVDYGHAEGCWFEARSALPALHGTRAQIHRTALHVVRFLRASGVELTADASAGAIRPAIEGASGAWRPIAHRLRPRESLEPLLATLDGGGAPGVATVVVSGPPRSGLRTARLQIARAARLAGFAPLDARFAGSTRPFDAARHYCVLDWCPCGDTLPRLLAGAAAHGGRRHVWFRFVRERAGAAIVRLQRFTRSELSAMVYADIDLGPTQAEVTAAAAAADGWPGPFIEALARERRGAAPAWVHEAAPAYVVEPAVPVSAAGAGPAREASRRILHLVDAARALALRGRHSRAERLLRRAIPALSVRGAGDAAAEASLALAALCRSRGRAADALGVLATANAWPQSRAVLDRLLLETAATYLDLLRLVEAEGGCRTLLAGAAEAEIKDAATVLLARVQLAGRRDAALGESLIARSPTAAALAGRIAAGAGDLRRAGVLGRQALALAAADDHAPRCEAEIVLMQVAALTGDEAAAVTHGGLAADAARQSRRPDLRLIVAAARLALVSGVARHSARGSRLVRTAAAYSPLCAQEVRERFAAAPPARGRDPLIVLERLLGLVFDASSDAEAVRRLADFLLAEIKACSVTVRGARGQSLANAGRPWTGDASVSDVVLTGGASICREDVVMPERGEPIRTGGTTIGCLAARWLPATGHDPAACRELMRLASVAVAPAVAALNTPPPDVTPAAAPDDLLGPGPAAGRIRELIRRAALAPYPVLIEGESGSGKELVARAIHARSARRARRFCAVNCAAFADELLEAELFGHARGAFTGAVGERLGLFEDADQGTLFLDEVAELSARAQAKLLRVLQEGEIRRVGETLARRVDVRILAASNRPLATEVDAARFRADLRFRLDVLRIAVPPLRERADEIPWLAERIWAEAAARVGTRATLSPEFLAALARYDWPGNVRELQNVLAAVAVHAPRRGRVQASDLPPHVARLAGRAAVTFESARLDFEQRFVRAALARAGGRRGIAARQLGVSRQGLAKMLKRLGIVEPC